MSLADDLIGAVQLGADIHAATREVVAMPYIKSEEKRPLAQVRCPSCGAVSRPGGYTVHTPSCKKKDEDVDEAGTVPATIPKMPDEVGCDCTHQIHFPGRSDRPSAHPHGKFRPVEHSIALIGDQWVRMCQDCFDDEHHHQAKYWRDPGPQILHTGSHHGAVSFGSGYGQGSNKSRRYEALGDMYGSKCPSCGHGGSFPVKAGGGRRCSKCGLHYGSQAAVQKIRTAAKATVRNEAKEYECPYCMGYKTGCTKCKETGKLKRSSPEYQKMKQWAYYHKMKKFPAQQTEAVQHNKLFRYGIKCSRCGKLDSAHTQRSHADKGAKGHTDTYNSVFNEPDHHTEVVDYYGNKLHGIGEAARGCECEHASHFDPSEGGIGGHHDYGDRPPNRQVKTDWGTFKVCLDCISAGHMTNVYNTNPKDKGIHQAVLRAREGREYPHSPVPGKTVSRPLSGPPGRSGRALAEATWNVSVGDSSNPIDSHTRHQGSGEIVRTSDAAWTRYPSGAVLNHYYYYPQSMGASMESKAEHRMREYMGDIHVADPNAYHTNIGMVDTGALHDPNHLPHGEKMPTPEEYAIALRMTGEHPGAVVDALLSGGIQAEIAKIAKQNGHVHKEEA